MDTEVQILFREAFDEVLFRVAEINFSMLQQGISDEDVAENILDSLDSFRNLQEGLRPEYNAWDAIFYGSWYQPAHINMAYSLIKNTPALNDSLTNTVGTLLVRDFGCGELAMAFGLALAAFDLALAGKPTPNIAVLAEDDSLAMKKFGNDLWEILRGNLTASDDARLNLLGDIVRGIRFIEEPEDADSAWVSVLHVAYPDIKAEVKRTVDALVIEHSPAWVIVSSHRRRYNDAYWPDLRIYESTIEYGRNHQSDLQLAIDGTLLEVTEFRRSLREKYDTHLNRIPNLSRYLQNDVRWVLPQEGNIITLYQPKL